MIRPPINAGEPLMARSRAALSYETCTPYYGRTSCFRTTQIKENELIRVSSALASVAQAAAGDANLMVHVPVRRVAGSLVPRGRHPLLIQSDTDKPAGT